MIVRKVKCGKKRMADEGYAPARSTKKGYEFDDDEENAVECS